LHPLNEGKIQNSKFKIQNFHRIYATSLDIEVLHKSCLNFELVTAKESLNEEIGGEIAVETVGNVMA
jgi:hypothetical protein